MRKFAKLFAGLIVFLTMLSMGVQQVTSFTMMSSGPVLPGQQRGIESLPEWGRWTVGAVAVVIAVAGVRKMMQSSGPERTGRREVKATDRA
jgi:hypothetical protein